MMNTLSLRCSFNVRYDIIFTYSDDGNWELVSFAGIADGHLYTNWFPVILVIRCNVIIKE